MNHRTVSLRKIAFATVAALSLGACQHYGPKQTGGALLGAGLGGLLGSQFGQGTGKAALTALGAFGGAVLGNQIGQSLDRADRAYLSDASYKASSARIGETITWSNPRSGNYGSVTPTREGVHAGTGAYCREFQQEIIVGGRKREGYGQACRMPDGSWKLI